MSCPEKELCQVDMVSKKDMGMKLRWIVGLFILIGLAIGGSFLDIKDISKIKGKAEATELAVNTLKDSDTNQNGDIKDLTQAQKETLDAFMKFQIENARQMGEILVYIKEQAKKDDKRYSNH